MTIRRKFLKAGAGLFAGLHGMNAFAQEYPVRPIRMLVGFPPGQATDLIARMVGVELAKSLGQPLITDNKPGAGATLAADAAAKAAPDGYTLLMSSSGPLCVAPSLYPKLPYDPLKDLIPISLIAKVPLVLVVNPAVPAKTFLEFLQLAKAPGTGLDYGSSGSGITNHLVMEMLRSMEKLNLTHVPYKGSGPAITDLIGGTIKVMFDTAPVTLPHVRSGRLRALAVTSSSRLPDLPNVPTIAESGLRVFEAVTWAALLAPRGTPPAILSRLNRDTIQAVSSLEVRTKLLALGAIPVSSSLEETAAYVRSETIKWGGIVREGKITID